MAEPVLEVAGLEKRFPLARGPLARSGATITALAGVSFRLAPGETLGIVGESGCGKTTLAKVVMRLVPPDAGQIVVRGADITSANGGLLRETRRHIQMVFQDPFSSLNPRMSCGRIVAEPLEIHGGPRSKALTTTVAAMFERVGLSPEMMARYPHQLSGGQRQRLGIARALALRPAIIVADEPVSALDVSVQAQVINLLADLQRDDNLAYLFISHDLAVVEHISHRVAVMYLGRIVELAPKRDLFSNPGHPYTEALLDAVPARRPGARAGRRLLAGEVPSPVDLPQGCAFQTRCPIAEERCRIMPPPLRRLAPGHEVACHVRAPAPG